MDGFSFTIAPYLRAELQFIDRERDKILLTLLQPATEIRLAWEAKINRINFSLRLGNTSIRRTAITNILSSKESFRPNAEEKLVLSNKRALDSIYQNWYLTDKRLDGSALDMLESILLPAKLKSEHKVLENILQFIEVNPEHPVIQAGLAQLLVLRALPISTTNEMFARFISYLFIYKYGYDFRRLLNMENYFYHNMAAYSQAVEKNLKEENVSQFLEFYIFAFKNEATAVNEKVGVGKFEMVMPESFFRLTERQKDILSLFDEPGIKVSNRMVQKSCKISQITASRDLAKVNSLGLILSHGKGDRKSVV